MSAPKIGMVSLGCPKALVDSERILTRLSAEGYAIAPDYQGADAVIVNTCGFLDSARAESLDAIGEALKENGKVIVTGCMGVDEAAIRADHPGVLAVTGPQAYEAVMEAVHKAVPPLPDPFQSLIPAQGLRLTPRHYAYLKISEGCSNRCTFCIIPSLRGDLVSRRIDDVMAEAQKLALAGVRELLVISQDTSAYGKDIRYEEADWGGQTRRSHVTDLAKALGELGIWVRMHYVYPYPHVDDLIPMMADGTILPYLDIPFQHASPSVLKAMKRPADQVKVLDRIKAWRKTCPDLAIRSTFIVGFPGETEEDFTFLLDWLKEAELDRVGCFKYEPVGGATANELPGAVAEEVKAERFARLMEVQQAVSEKRLARKIGQTIEVIIDEVDEEGAIGRSHADAPEIDGCVFLNGETGFEPGDIIMAEVEEADHYDLWAKPKKVS